MNTPAKHIGDITIQEVIKIVPLDDEKRKSLLVEFKDGSTADNYDVSNVLWNAFHDLYEELTEIKFQQLQYEEAAGSKPMSSNLYMDAQGLVWKDFQDVLSGKKAEIDQMSEIREKLRQLADQSKGGTVVTENTNPIDGGDNQHAAVLNHTPLPESFHEGDSTSLPAGRQDGVGQTDTTL